MDIPSDELRRTNLHDSLPHTGEGIVIDIGTGDGRFVYECARQNPRKFYIGIDPNIAPLAKISEKIHRKPAKGGAPNVMFLQAAIEDLPPELDGLADEVHVHFPWGSLLKAVATGEETALRNLRRICAGDALLEVVMGLDRERDQKEIERLDLPDLSRDYLKQQLVPRYHATGFEVVEHGTFTPTEWPEVRSSWAKRLRENRARVISYLVARALPLSSETGTV